MKKSNKVCPDFSKVFNKQRKGCSKQSTEERVKKLYGCTVDELLGTNGNYVTEGGNEH